MPTRDAVVVAILAGLLLFVAFNLQAGWVYAIVGLLAGLLVMGAGTAHLAVRSLVVSRAMPAEVFAGDRIPVTLTVRAGRWPRFFISLDDRMPGVEPATVFVPVVWPGRAHTLTYQTHAVRRGEHRGGLIIVRSLGLTGLFRASRRINAGGTLTIFPNYSVLRRFPFPGSTTQAEADARRRSRGGTEFEGVREFHQGDSLRHVHWRSTARRGQLVIREFEEEGTGSVTLLLDARDYSREEQPFEDLVRAAASVAHFITQSGGAVRIVAGQRDGVLHAVGGWTDALHALARIERNGGMTPQAVVDAAGLPATSPLVVFTSDVDSAATLSRRGHGLTVVLTGVAEHAALMLPAMGIATCVLGPQWTAARLEAMA